MTLVKKDASVPKYYEGYCHNGWHLFPISIIFWNSSLGEKHSEDSTDNKYSPDLTCEKAKDSGFMIDMGNSTFGNNNLDKVRDPNLNNENKETET